MEEMTQLADRQLDKEARDIFSAYLSFLNDGGLYRKISGLIKTKKINAEHAVNDVFEEYIKGFEKKDKHFRELANDFIDIRNRIIGAFNLETGKFKCAIGEKDPVIVASKRLTPSMVLGIQRENVLAFVTEQGGFTNHATILARSYGVPNIYGINVTDNLDCGMNVIVDGSLGKVIISPDEKTSHYYDRKIKAIEQKKTLCLVKKDLAPRTKGGERIKLKVNISISEELHAIREMPHDGIGLLRTEFLFVQRDKAPSEDEQYTMYKSILEENPGKPVSIRLLDIGLDKKPLYLKMPDKITRDIELRGAVAVESFPDIYLSQMKALLRAGAGMTNLQLLYPMVSDLYDLETFRNIIREAGKILKKEKAEFNNENIKEGVMIETPSAVMMAEELLNEVDFVNIGSNDLLQYSLAAFRGNSMVEDRYHILHPTLVKMMDIIARAGRKFKKEICLCGEIAFFEEFYPLFLQMGLKSFSVAVSKFSDIKCELLNLHIPRNKDMLKEFYKIHSKESISEYFMKKI
ncbi:MAG: phosphoenolpyruvate--protein phosphotransferase [Elusimicrobiota bacterium]